MTAPKQKSTQIALSASERKLIVEMGSRWLRMSVEEILSENAVLFRLAVAIVGQKRSRIAVCKGAREMSNERWLNFYYENFRTMHSLLKDVYNSEHYQQDCEDATSETHVVFDGLVSGIDAMLYALEGAVCEMEAGPTAKEQGK